MSSRLLEKETVLDTICYGNVVLYRRKGSKHDSVIWYRLSIPGVKGQRERKSTKTNDIHQAAAIAQERYEDLRARKRQNVTVFTKNFQSLCEAYLEDLQHRYNVGEYGMSVDIINLAKWTIQNYFIPFFGDRDVNTFSADDIRAFHKWRLAKWEEDKDKVVPMSFRRHKATKDGKERTVNRKFSNVSVKKPSAQSQSRDEGVFKQIMQYGLESKWLLPNEMPVFRRTKVQKRKRGSFTDEEFKLLTDYLNQRVIDAENGSFRGRINPRIVHQARMLRDYVYLLAFSGIRVGEARNLKFRDLELIKLKDKDYDIEKDSLRFLTEEQKLEKLLEDGDTTNFIDEFGAVQVTQTGLETYILEKMGQELPKSGEYWEGYDLAELKITVSGKTGFRDVIAQPELIQVRDSIFDQHFEIGVGSENMEDAYLFVNTKGQLIHSFKETFSKILTELGLKESKSKMDEGCQRSLYSLRHYYATKRLEEGVDIYLLAKNMGTSVKQIENHYSHVLTARHGHKLTAPKGTRSMIEVHNG